MININEGIGLLSIKRHKEDSCKACVSDNNQDSVVKACLPPIVHRDDEVFQLQQISKLLHLVIFLRLRFLFLLLGLVGVRLLFLLGLQGLDVGDVLLIEMLAGIALLDHTLHVFHAVQELGSLLDLLVLLQLVHGANL